MLSYLRDEDKALPLAYHLCEGLGMATDRLAEHPRERYQQGNYNNHQISDPAKLKNIFLVYSRGWLSDRRLRERNHLRTINKFQWVVADNSKFCHRGLEVNLHEELVVDHALPLAGSALYRTQFRNTGGFKFLMNGLLYHERGRNPTADASHQQRESAS